MLQSYHLHNLISNLFTKMIQCSYMSHKPTWRNLRRRKICTIFWMTKIWNCFISIILLSFEKLKKFRSSKFHFNDPFVPWISILNHQYPVESLETSIEPFTPSSVLHKTHEISSTFLPVLHSPSYHLLIQ